MATNYDTTTVPGIRVPTAANNGNDFAAGVLQMAGDQQAAYLPATWTSLTLGTNISTGSGIQLAAARAEAGGLVRLRGFLHNSSGSSIAANAVLATIPSALRRSPAYTAGAMTGSGVAVAVAFNTAGAGTIVIANVGFAAGDTLYLDSIPPFSIA
jgi:hypothetical protein